MFCDVYGALSVVKDGFEDADKDAIALEFGATAVEIAEKAGVSELEAEQVLVQLRYEDEYRDVQMFNNEKLDIPHLLEVGQ